MIVKPRAIVAVVSAVVVAWGLALSPVAVTNAELVGDVALPSGKENTSVIVQNGGTEPATIVMDVYRNDGTIVPGATREEQNVPVGGTRNFPQVSNNALELGFRGLGVLSATQPINALIVRDILNSAGLKSYSIASGAANGGRKLAVPIAFNELITAQWNSRIAVVNAGTQTACIKVTYYLVPNVGGAATQNQTITDQPTGQAGCPGGGYAVPVSGQVTFGRAGAGVTRFPVSTDNNQMAVQIEVLNAGDNNVAANVDLYRSDGNRLLGAYEALVINEAAPGTDDVGTDVIIPLTIKSASGFYSVIGVLNTTGVGANVQIQYVGTSSGSPVNHTVTLTNITNVGVHSIYSSPEIPVGFIGYARVTSAQPLAAVLVRGKQTVAFSGVNEPTYSAGRGVPVDQAATSYNTPLIFRRFNASLPTYFGYNSWIQVQVADGSTAQVTLRFVGDPVFGGACPVGPYQATFTVTGSKVFLMNADSDNGFPVGNSPTCFFGGAQVTASKPVIVISNVTSDLFPGSDTDGLYNAFK